MHTNWRCQSTVTGEVEDHTRVAQESGHSPSVILKRYAKWLNLAATARNPRATIAVQPTEMTEVLSSRSKFNVPLGVESQGFCALTQLPTTRGTWSQRFSWPAGPSQTRRWAKWSGS